MGLGIGISNWDTPYACSKCGKTSHFAIGNPNPYNFKIIVSYHIGEYLALQVRYPDCKNYNGMKVLVFKGHTLTEIEARTSIDPHFADNDIDPSPVARFTPTEAGWSMAKRFINLSDAMGN